MNILTFDIEEWFHILDNDATKTEMEWSNYESRIHQNMDKIFRLLDDYNVKATFFCLGWIADKYPDVIKQIHELGYEIGTHSNMHQLAYEMTPDEYRNDLKKSIDTLEQFIGAKVKSYRAPGFSITQNNLWAFEVLHELGIENDSSVFPANRAHGGIPDFKESNPCIISYQGVEIKEFPISTYNILGKDLIYSGGGYFRLFPYKAIKYMSKRSDYMMTYFHPRDFDPHQPMVEGLNLFRKFKSYYGLKTSYSKLRKFVSEYHFTDLKTYGETIDWDRVPKVELA